MAEEGVGNGGGGGSAAAAGQPGDWVGLCGVGVMNAGPSGAWERCVRARRVVSERCVPKLSFAAL